MTLICYAFGVFLIIIGTPLLVTEGNPSLWLLGLLFGALPFIWNYKRGA